MLLPDLRHALRTLRRSPGFAAAAILTLALGIGANTAIFSVVRGVLLRPLEYGEADRLVAIFASEREGSEPRNPSSPANFLDIRERSRTLEQVTAATPWSPTLTGSPSPQRLQALRASPELFALLEVPPALGRPFSADLEDQRVVVLGYDLWRTMFGADPAIVGSSLTLDGEAHTVLAVMPPGFEFPPFWATGAQLWAPLHFTPEEAAKRGSSYLRIFGRLVPGATVQAAQREMAAIGAQLTAEFPENSEGLTIRLEPLQEPVVSSVRPALLVLFAAVGLVLLIACANVANLLLGRAMARRREFVIRSALGAHRRRLVQQGLTESLVLALAGGAIGLLLATWSLDLLRARGLATIPRGAEVQLDLIVVAYTLFLCLATALLFGIVPALRMSASNLAGALRSRSGDTGGKSYARRALAAIEISLALILLIGAGLLIKSLQRLQAVDLGFRTEALQTMTISLAASENADPARQNPFFTSLLERVEGLPGVRSAALINHLPIAGDTWWSGFSPEGRAAPDPDDGLTASMRAVSPDYFPTMEIPLVGGRDFDERDREGSVAAVIVNATMARRLWPEGDAVGQRVRMGGLNSEEPWRTVVGIVGDTPQGSAAEAPTSEIFFPLAQNPFSWYTSAALVVWHEPAWAGAAAVTETVWALDGNVPVSQVMAMEQILSDQLSSQRLITLLLVLFAGTALLLAIVGVFGVISYLVTQRTQEIGIRMALGARATDVAGMVLRESMLLTGGAVVAGLLAAGLLTRFLGTLLFEVNPTDPVIFGGTALLIGAVALVAAVIPARRAMRVQPMVALRGE
jgi:predicted permease